MLEVIMSDGRQALACDDYVVVRAYNGQDTVEFSLSRRDPAALVLKERTRVYETTGGQTYLVSGIDAGQSEVSYVLKKDLSDWEKTVYPGFTNGTSSATAEATIRRVLPAGWTLTCLETDNLAAYISLQGPTALEVVEHCREVYGCTVVFDTAAKTAAMHFPAKKQLGPSFLVETANLRSAPEYKSKAGGLVTRLYAQGAEGMNFASINGGKAYVECFDYTDEVVAGFWRDDRYTVAEHLLQAAREKVKVLSQPERSWTLQIADLQSVDSETWPDMELGLYDVVMLVDPSLGQKMEAQITGMRTCPHHPERNEISIETRDNTMRSLTAAIRAGQQKDGLYQDLVVTVDRVRQDLGVTSGSVENIRLAADAAQASADAAQASADSAGDTILRIVNGTYTGGAFIDGKHIYAPEIYGQEIKLVNSAAGSIPTLSFYPRNGSSALLSLAAGGSSSAGYSADLSSKSDLLLRAVNSVVLQGGTTPGPSGYTGVTVEGNAAIYGKLSFSGTTMQDFVSAKGKSGSWYYRKWNSGQVELWATIAFRAASSTALGNGYYSNDLTATLPFSVSNATAVANADGSCFVCGTSVSDKTLTCYLLRTAPVPTTANVNIRFMIMGTWK